jgi:phosphoglycolate phosphatase
VFSAILGYKRRMMKEVDLMIFDFDGTLVSTGIDLAAAVNYTLQQLDIPMKSEDEIIAFVGDGVRKLIERSLGVQSILLYDDAIKIFGKYYSEHLLDNTTICPSVKDVLENFAKKKKVIITNKRYDFTIAIVRGLTLEKHFIEIIGEDSTLYKKPDKRLVDDLLNKYNVPREKFVIIGDGMNDVLLAKNARIISCIYLNGLGRRQDLLEANADYYCEDLLEINSLFC